MLKKALIEKSKKNLLDDCKYLQDEITKICNSHIELLEDPQTIVNEIVIVNYLHLDKLIEQVSSIFSNKPLEPPNYLDSQPEPKKIVQ